MLFFWVYICKIKVYNNIIRGFVVVVCMVNLFLFLFVVEGGFIKDIWNKVLNFVDYIVIDVLYINFMFMLDEILLYN